MASINLAIHIPPDANPVNISALISTLAQDRERFFASVQELLHFSEAQGIGARTEMQHTATQLGLLVRTSGGITISEDGMTLAAIKEGVQGDILHYLIYTRWHEADPLSFLPSWSYRTSCDSYWNTQRLRLTDEYLDQQVGEIINMAEMTFTEMGFEEIGTISFSRKSLVGLHNWLYALNPPVIEDGVFSRRSFCHPELLLLAIGYVMRDEDAATETDILLSHDKRAAICRICLLEPDALDRTLDWMIPIYPKVIEPGTSAGFYGRFIRLHKIPTLADVVR